MEFAISAADALSRIADPIQQTLILILSDINMPGMTGLEMLPKVREMRPDVPVIMITAYGDPETRRKAIEGGAAGLLTKPIDFTLLREEIDARLDQAAWVRWCALRPADRVLTMCLHRNRPEATGPRSKTTHSTPSTQLQALNIFCST